MRSTEKPHRGWPRAVKVMGIVLIGVATISWGAAPPTSTPPSAAEPAPPAPSATPQEYVGSEVCRACHADRFSSMEQSEMGKVILRFPRTDQEKRGCEGCHGPRSLHVTDPANAAYRQGLFGEHGKKATPARQNEVCLVCHDKGEHIYWAGSAHDRQHVACVSCHRLHTPAFPQHLLAKPDEFQLCGSCHLIRRAQLMRTSHMPLRESKMTCSDCHNPHGSVAPRLVRGNTANELCYRCHAERRGPFLWEHQPVKENCMYCHKPHGSIHDHLLTRKAERLCQTCHIPTRHPTQPHGPQTRYVFNRSCRNCHSQIHGSNHPSGKFFLR